MTGAAAERPSLLVLKAKSALFWEILGYHTRFPDWSALRHGA